jgi:GDP-4-dehydro-6-deoxy-D-mannose reductase
VKAFVTGAGGFAGPHLVRHLRECGDEVVVSDRRGPQPLDVLDRACVHQRLAAHAPDVVYHLAAFTEVGESWRLPDQVLRINVEGTANVLDAARAASVGRVVVVGSAEEYGLVEEADRPLTETTPLRPNTPYGASKVAASYLALQAWLGTGQHTVRVRPFNHTGPGQSARFLVPALAHRIVRAERDGRDEVIVGSLAPVRDFNDVRDIVRAYRMLAIDGEAGDVYNVCSGRAVSVADVAARLLAMSSRPLRLVQDPDLVRPVETPRLVGDASKLRATTGWEPKYDLDATLHDVLQDARNA